MMKFTRYPAQFWNCRNGDWMFLHFFHDCREIDVRNQWHMNGAKDWCGHGRFVWCVKSDQFRLPVTPPRCHANLTGRVHKAADDMHVMLVTRPRASSLFLYACKAMQSKP
jgi:hypothetical protein